MLIKTLVRLINLYQKTFSRDHGYRKDQYPFGYCKYSPTCSDYAKEALLKKGILKGIILSIWRILRCNPLSKGGYDPVS